MNFTDSLKKKYVRDHPLFINRNKELNNTRKIFARYAQEIKKEKDNIDFNDVFYDFSEEASPNDKRLSSMIRSSIIVTEDLFSNFHFPLPPKIEYKTSRNIKYSDTNDDVVSGIINLNCKITAANGSTKQLEIPVSIVNKSIIPPSVMIYEGRMPIIAQSTIDEITQRTTSYELPPIRDMYSAPLNLEEREMAVSTRNEFGWQPRGIGGLVPNRMKSGKTKESAYTPNKTPPGYNVVTEKMLKAEEAGEDTFPRAWQYLLTNYILKCVNTASRDAWEIHLINDGFAINPWARGCVRRKGQTEGPSEEEIEEVVEEVIQKMYRGTNMPIEVGDPARYNSKNGPIRGKILEINPDEDYLILGSKGVEYRVNVDKIEPLDSTYKGKWAKMSQEFSIVDKLVKILNSGVYVAAVDGHVIDLDGSGPIYIGIVHDGSGYIPGAGVWISDSGSEDEALQNADDVLSEHQADEINEADYDVTESWDGMAFTLTIDEFIDIYNNLRDDVAEKFDDFIVDDEEEVY